MYGYVRSTDWPKLLAATLNSLLWQELSIDRNYSVLNIVFKIKVTKFAQKMLFSKKKKYFFLYGQLYSLPNFRKSCWAFRWDNYYGCNSDRVASLSIIHVFVTESAKPVPQTRGTQLRFSNWSSLSTYGRQYTLPCENHHNSHPLICILLTSS